MRHLCLVRPIASAALCTAGLGLLLSVTACSDASGQSWEFVPEGNFFRLRTEWQGSTKCLDANVPTNLALHAGGAYMADCQDVPGQRWEVLTP